MLILNRKKGETIVIGDNIRVTIADIQGDNVKIGIEASQDIVILREEIQEAIKTANRQASETPKGIVDSLAKLNTMIGK